MKINKDWHDAHKLPRTANLEQRLTWHLKHAAACGCREMPPTIRRELESRGLLEPSPASLK